MNSTRTKALALAAGVIVSCAAALPALGTNGHQLTVQLTPVNSFHQSGTATLTPSKTGFVVMLHVKGSNLHDHQEPYIHDVTCKRYTHLIPHPFKPTAAELQRELATVTNDLTPIVNGKSKTTVPQPLKSLTTGGYSIVLDGWDWAGTAAACGTIPRQ